MIPTISEITKVNDTTVQSTARDLKTKRKTEYTQADCIRKVKD